MLQNYFLFSLHFFKYTITILLHFWLKLLCITIADPVMFCTNWRIVASLLDILTIILTKILNGQFDNLCPNSCFQRKLSLLLAQS